MSSRCRVACARYDFRTVDFGDNVVNGLVFPSLAVTGRAFAEWVSVTPEFIAGLMNRFLFLIATRNVIVGAVFCRVGNG